MTITSDHYKHKVSFDAGGDIEIANVTAAYFVVDDRFTTFKDGSHKAVFAVSTDRVVCIRRGDRLDESQQGPDGLE